MGTAYKWAAPTICRWSVVLGTVIGSTLLTALAVVAVFILFEIALLVRRMTAAAEAASTTRNPSVPT